MAISISIHRLVIIIIIIIIIIIYFYHRWWKMAEVIRVCVSLGEIPLNIPAL